MKEEGRSSGGGGGRAVGVGSWGGREGLEQWGVGRGGVCVGEGAVEGKATRCSF